MKNKRIKKRYITVFIVLLLFVVSLIGGRGIYPAFADTADNLNVLKELQKDSNFNADNYPYKEDDYSIYVIQIAESDRGNLYIYTYQPCQLSRYIIATDINMSLSESAEGTKLYDLVFVNTEGVFAKYLVKGVKAIDNPVRYYNITSIYRAWDKDIDTGTDNNNEINKKAFPVRNVYKITTENGVKIYSRNETYTVEILDPYSDYLIYTQNAGLPSIGSIQFSFNKWGMIDAHYIAFSTDWEIDRLRSATVFYRYRNSKLYYDEFLGFDCGGDVSYGEPLTDYAYPTYLDKFEISGNFWNNGITYNYSWDRIQTVAEFIATEKKLTDETKSNLSGKQWVLRFKETQRTQKETNILGYKKYVSNFTNIDYVSVLRLEFESDGTVYNLGTVCDMVSGDEFAGNEEEAKVTGIWDKIKAFFKDLFNDIDNAPWWVWLIVALVVLAVGLPILGVAVPAVGEVLLYAVKGIGYGIKYLFTGLWWLICLPFRGIVALIGKIKGE